MLLWTLYEYQGAFTAFRESDLEDDPELSAEVDQRLLRLRELGNLATMPVSEPFGEGLFCCRASSAGHHARLMYCFLPKKRIVILLCALKDQRTLAPGVIAEARKRKKLVDKDEGDIDVIDDD
jgi:hypothetical protein